MDWKIEFLEDAVEDLQKLDAPVQKEVLKGIIKVSQNPLPNSEGGYGKPLGNHSATKLAGCCKIKFKNSGIRVVYRTDKKNDVMLIIIISVRSEDYVYIHADTRLGR